tara:strand:- start:212 stop:601 length:390 start_codon:yes stop_codon:yes gene_type:complete
LVSEEPTSNFIGKKHAASTVLPLSMRSCAFSAYERNGNAAESLEVIEIEVAFGRFFESDCFVFAFFFLFACFFLFTIGFLTEIGVTERNNSVVVISSREEFEGKEAAAFLKHAAASIRCFAAGSLDNNF